MTQPEKKTRRAMLEEFAAAHPNDAFARYGLAIECANQGDHAAATENFDKLLSRSPQLRHRLLPIRSITGSPFPYR